MSALQPFQFHVLAHPWVLLLLIAVLLILAAEWFARPAGALSVSTGDTLARIRSRSRIHLRRLPAILRALGLALLVIALARPLAGMRPRVERVNVVDILLCVDVSGSMTAQDFIDRDRGVLYDRLFVTKVAVRDFIESRKMRSGDRYGMDRVGLVLYAAHSWIQCPLTLDYAIFERELGKVAIDKNDAKTNRTAIGSAIGLSVSNLNRSEAESKVIVLLTDGNNNHGNLDPITAALLAEDYGIRVYTIGAGSPDRGRMALGDLVAARNDPIDEATLKKIAETTGGKYYRATDLASLQEAYQEINELETTEIQVEDVYDYEDAFLPYALLGGLAVTLSILTRRQWFEAIP